MLRGARGLELAIAFIFDSQPRSIKSAAALPHRRPKDSDIRYSPTRNRQSKCIHALIACELKSLHISIKKNGLRRILMSQSPAADKSSISDLHMLDAFIIEKIQKERDLRDSGREQLHIEIRRDRLHDERARKEEKTEERGIAIIDFNI